MNKVIVPVILSLFLIGCAKISGGLQAARVFNDSTAVTLITGMCGITVGAYYRLDNPIHKEGIIRLCGGDNQIELGE